MATADGYQDTPISAIDAREPQTAMAETRKLATILAIDIAGYSRAMEQNDSIAAARVSALREAASAIAAPLGGRIFSTAGDGLMLEFPAASSGVQAALAILAETKSAARPLPKIRIGVHLGEVIVAENGDLLGHGVNVAARLQALAAPGAALISETVRAQLRAAGAVALTPHGKVQLDKMSESVVVYSLGAAAGPAAPIMGFLGSAKIGQQRLARWGLIAAALAVLALGLLAVLPRDRASLMVAVLPFAPENATGPAQAFAEGFSTELHDVLAQSGGDLALLGYASSSGLRIDPDRVRKLYRELNVSHVVDGSVLRAGDKITVNVALIDARTGAQLWRDRVEDSFANLYPLQVRIAKRMREALRLASPEGAGLSVDPKAMRLYMSTLGPDTVDPLETMRQRIDALNQAVAIQPDFARAWHRLAFIHSNYRYTAPSQAERERARRDGQTAARRYLDLAPKEARAHYWAAEFETDPAARNTLLQAALILAKDDPDVLSLWSAFLTAQGRAEDGYRMASRAATLDPYSDFVISRQVWRAIALSDLDAAETILKDKRVPVRAAAVRWYHVVMGWLAQDNRIRARDALPYLTDAVNEIRTAQVDGRTTSVDDAAGQLVLELATAALAAESGAANKRRANAFVNQIDADIARIPPDLVFAHLAFVSIVAGPDRAFSLWDKRLRAIPPLAGTGVAPDRETGAAYLSWPFASMTRLHRDPRIFTFLARYPILRNEPFPNEAGELAAMLALMKKRPPDFCTRPGFPYACAEAIDQALAAR
jgi:adenylate cyclase